MIFLDPPKTIIKQTYFFVRLVGYQTRVKRGDHFCRNSLGKYFLSQQGLIRNNSKQIMTSTAAPSILMSAEAESAFSAESRDPKWMNAKS